MASYHNTGLSKKSLTDYQSNNKIINYLTELSPWSLVLH